MAKDLEQLSIANETYNVKDKNAVHKSGNERIEGTKTFASAVPLEVSGGVQSGNNNAVNGNAVFNAIGSAIDANNTDAVLPAINQAITNYDGEAEAKFVKKDATYIKLLANVSAMPSFINDFSFANTTNPIRPFGLDDDCAFSFTVNANSGAVIFPQNSLNDKWFTNREGTDTNAKARLFTTVIRTVAGTTSSSVTREIKNLAGTTYFYLAANLSRAYDSHEHVELVFTLEREDASKVYSVTCFLTIRFFYSVTSAENSTAYFTAKTFKKVYSKV